MKEYSFHTGKEYQLDKKDKKILLALLENGRYTVAQIAKKTGLRRDSIIYRIKKLEENKIILDFQPLISAPALGFPNVAQLLLKTKISNKEDKDFFIKKLKQEPTIVHISITIGRFDIYLAIIYKEHTELYKTIEQIKSIKPDYILDYEILQVVDDPKFEDMEGLIKSLS